MGSRIIRVCVTAAIAATLGLFGVAGTGTAVAAPSPTPAVTVVGGCDGAKLVQPRTLSSIFCADVGVIVSDITWLAWTDGFAAGFGTENRKLCKPDCASGSIAKYPVGIWLFAPKNGAFTQVSLYSSIAGPPETYQLTGHVR
ncbi:MULTISPECIES: hypothetical protein [Gordonia]|uniref:Lipoprotein n=1 Tax=Gordonia amicalis TaxID=89053 RepID=A0AAE4R6Q3_9ACTN|nr:MULTISPECIES: hypothetical protein [Gordonia]ATD72682.1 hypothetical protein CNO18_22870 [Gordonia sp. 1D]KAF0971365.1 hypothetical protein BPODLACK_00551 [Gordonia sp. YY1]MCR8898246.1 hypothetical protein [Gordonia sp. GONU]MCZ0915301.1 hypothetical protein [Gordonia amicalis]MCZ4578337.1 hypothetical protein [Gordonia amicalis]